MADCKTSERNARGNHTDGRPRPPAVSVVIPFFNEAGNAALLLRDLHRALREFDQDYEVILVDDGSTDRTGAVLAETALELAWSTCRVVSFAENKGQAAALYHGLKRACGDVILTLDGDGQNSPGDMFALLEALENADMVVGVRVDRHDSWLRRHISRLANCVRSCVLGDGMSDSGCALKAFRREVVEAFIPIRTLYSFMPALAAAAGFRVIQVPVTHLPRVTGVSSYGLRAFLWRPVLDLLGVWWFTRRRCATRIALTVEGARQDAAER